MLFEHKGVFICELGLSICNVVRTPEDEGERWSGAKCYPYRDMATAVRNIGKVNS